MWMLNAASGWKRERCWNKICQKASVKHLGFYQTDPFWFLSFVKAFETGQVQQQTKRWDVMWCLMQVSPLWIIRRTNWIDHPHIQRSLKGHRERDEGSVFSVRIMSLTFLCPIETNYLSHTCAHTQTTTCSLTGTTLKKGCGVFSTSVFCQFSRKDYRRVEINKTEQKWSNMNRLHCTFKSVLKLSCKVNFKGCTTATIWTGSLQFTKS